MNTRRMNRLEELGRVDSEKAFTKKGKRNLKDEKKRIVRELKKDGGKVKKSDKGAINPGEKDEERQREYRKKRQKEAAKIDMVSKLAKRQKKGKFSKSPDGRSKATDTEQALTTFDVQKIMDARKNPKRDYDSISDRNLSRKEGSMAKGGKVLKPVDKSKNPGLAKLPTQVRNKMGYMKKGGRVKMKSGGIAKRGMGCEIR